MLQQVTGRLLRPIRQIVSTLCNDKIYIYSAEQENYIVTGYDFKVYDIEKGKIEEKSFIADGTKVDNTYCIGVLTLLPEMFTLELLIIPVRVICLFSLPKES